MKSGKSWNHGMDWKCFCEPLSQQLEQPCWHGGLRFDIQYFSRVQKRCEATPQPPSDNTLCTCLQA